MEPTSITQDFPYALTLHIPFPTHRLAKAALQTISVDQELSPLVRRSFSLVESMPKSHSNDDVEPAPNHASSTGTVLKTEYRATTNRMLRVSVNGFFDSLGTVIQVMEELDVDVLHEKGFEDLEGVQGVEQGLTGITATGA